MEPGGRGFSSFQLPIHVLQRPALPSAMPERTPLPAVVAGTFIDDGAIEDC